MRVEQLHMLLTQAAAVTGTNVSLGLYANGGIYIDGHDCKGSIDHAVRWLEHLAETTPSKEKQYVS